VLISDSSNCLELNSYRNVYIPDNITNLRSKIHELAVVVVVVVVFYELAEYDPSLF
jgi:hypothetical protein